jgi:hypothetical protein
MTTNAGMPGTRSAGAQGKARVRMAPVVGLALLSLVAIMPPPLIRAQVPDTSSTVIVIAGKGEIAGTISSSTGRRLKNVTMQLLGRSGAIVATTVTGSDGQFRFPEKLDFGAYTVQCVSRRRVAGTASVTLVEPSKSVSMICAVDPGYWEQWGLLTGLAAAAGAAATVGIVAAGDPASPSR